MTHFLSISLSVILLAAGLTKVLGLKFQKQHFKHWNLSLTALYGIGIAEVVTAIALFFTTTQYLGAISASFILIGATITCLIVSDYKRAILPFTLWIVAVFLLWKLTPFATSSIAVIGATVLLLLVAMLLWAYPTTPMNKDGDREFLNDATTVIHHFKTVLGVRYHYVTAGNPNKEAVVLVHGAPESWYAWHHQIIALSKEYFVLTLDMKPYGQTGKDLDGNHSFPHIAEEIKALLAALQIDKFHIVSQDRGVIATDHLLSKTGMQDRILSYVRMQQSFNEPHGDPVPPHHLMGSFLGTMVYKLRFGMTLVYRKSNYVQKPLPKKIVRRLTREFQFKGIPQAMPLSFKTTSFDKERQDRYDKLFAYMTMPILILQGRFDPGQHPEEYEKSHEFGSNIRVQFVECGHFLHLEKPAEVNAIMLDFFLTRHEM